MLRDVAAGSPFSAAPTGYSLNTLQVALKAFFSTDTYRDCITKAIYMGGDTDTQAAVAGALAGAYYGIEGIPKEWSETLLNKDLIANTAKMLLQQKPHIAATI